MQQILLVQRVDFIVRVLLDETRVDDVWFAFVSAAFERFDAVEGETTRQTGDCAKQTFKGLGESMTDIIFIDLTLKRTSARACLDHCPP